jgi:hypothetical protein
MQPRKVQSTVLIVYTLIILALRCNHNLGNIVQIRYSHHMPPPDHRWFVISHNDIGWTL